MTEGRGEIVTFYSYKGGTGRTMALANVAWILAAAGKRVLVADWDLEAPGLHKFFAPFLDVRRTVDAPGVIDLIREYEDHVMHERPLEDGDDSWLDDLARVQRHTIKINWDFPDGGRLDLLTAGRQNSAYAAALGSLDWDNFYDRLNGGKFLDAVAGHIRSTYDYALIDSRTGFSDVADICTQHLPDTLVDCFTLSNQGIDGAAQVARAVSMYSKRDGRRTIRILPVTMRVDQGEQERGNLGRKVAMERFRGLPEGMSSTEREQFFRSVEVPYQPYYAFEEKLATFFEVSGHPATLLAAYERLTSAITSGAVSALQPMEESLREQVQPRFVRTYLAEALDVTLEYAVEDQPWAEWVRSVLIGAEVTVHDHGPLEQHHPEAVREPVGTVLAIVSARYLSAMPPDRWRTAGPQPLVLYVGDVHTREIPARSAVTIGIHAEEKAAVDSLLSLVGRSSSISDAQAGATRFPGHEPIWFRAPARNPRFTGRTEQLQALRAALLADGQTVLPVALQGMGGVGKTQIALEYVHRFRASYDLVWWIQADLPHLIDSALTDLGVKMKLPVEVDQSAGDTTRMTMDALRRGTPTRRWLLVFDNADEVAPVLNFVPQGGGGHVLVTSRLGEWDTQAKTTIPVNVFGRIESVSHLRGRADLTEEQAEVVAEALGDLPIVVAAAGALLSDGTSTVESFLADIGRHQLHSPAVWDTSLQRLKDQSAGAYRLLQLCSVLGPDIAQDLLDSDQMAQSLMAFDPIVSERMMRATLIQRVNKLALLKLDVHARQVQVHRMIQEAVRSKMSEEELRQTRHEAHLILARFRPTGDPDNPDTWERYRMIWPHLDASGALACDDESVRQLLIDRVRYLWRRGNNAQGLEFGEQVAREWQAWLQKGEQQVAGAEAPSATNAGNSLSLRRQLLNLRFNIANILRDLARFTEALATDEDVLQQQLKLLGERHPHTLMTVGSLGGDLRALGRYEEALKHDERTYQLWREDFGEDYPRTLTAANNLAASMRAVGDFHRARVIDEAVFKRRQIVLGADHPFTLHSQSSVGRDLREAGEYAASVSWLRTVVDLSRESLGAEAVGTLNAQANLGASLRSDGRAAEAGPLLDEAYAQLSGRSGAEGLSPNALSCRLNRAANLLAVGRNDEAFSEMVQITLDYERTLGPDHPFRFVCLSNQSAVLRASGQLPQARDLAERAVIGCRRLLGERHPYYLAAAMNLGICRFELGELEGLPQDLVVLQGTVNDVLGRAHPDALAFSANLDVIRHARPGPRGSTSALGELTEQLGQDHPSVTSLRSRRLVHRVLDLQDPF
jgi:tetratricopeptide (TPR) repeat protein